MNQKRLFFPTQRKGQVSTPSRPCGRSYQTIWNIRTIKALFDAQSTSKNQGMVTQWLWTRDRWTFPVRLGLLHGLDLFPDNEEEDVTEAAAGARWWVNHFANRLLLDKVPHKWMTLLVKCNTIRRLRITILDYFIKLNRTTAAPNHKFEIWKESGTWFFWF